MFDNDAIFHAMLAQASDPATPADDLERLAALAQRESVHDQRGYFSRLMDGEGDHLARASAVVRAVAGNPNARTTTLVWLAGVYPGDVLDNPVMLLLALEGAWFEWTGAAIAHLRKKAHESGHRLFPNLAQVCYPAWHYRLGHESPNAVPWCHDILCAACCPNAASEYLRLWQHNRGYTTT